MDRVKGLQASPEGRDAVQAVIPNCLHVGLASHGSDNSRSNERYRYWVFKTGTYKNLRDVYYEQIRAFAAHGRMVDLPQDPGAFMGEDEAFQTVQLPSLQ